MIYELKNGTNVTIRPPVEADAQAILDLIATADAQTRFLAREPGEFAATLEQEQRMIAALQREPDMAWFCGEYEGHIVGHCSVGLVRNTKRYRHRAEVALLVLQDYWGLGIGGKLMQSAISWCQEKGLEQLELGVVADNHRALAMYQSFGFQIVGTLPHALRYSDGTYADEHLMVKIL